MTKKFAIILSGCGQFDGSETHETVILLLAMTQQGIEWDAFAPDITQHKVYDHYTQQDVDETRRVLPESARLVRGHIKPLSEADPDAYDAVILPGGFGAAQNICDYALYGEKCTLQAEVKVFLSECVSLHKPLGFICIAPVMIPKLYPSGVKMTIGKDEDIAAEMTRLGAEPVPCAATDCVVDKVFKVVSTPANMNAKNIAEVYTGINKLVKAVAQLV
jgi:enhancing lycopene biosynthesis protein 2